MNYNISLLELRAKWMLVSTRFIRAYGRSLVPPLGWGGGISRFLTHLEWRRWFYDSIGREEGFSITFGKRNWQFCHFDPLQIRTYSTTFGHSSTMRTRVVWVNKASGHEARPSRVRVDCRLRPSCVPGYLHNTVIQIEAVAIRCSSTTQN